MKLRGLTQNLFRRAGFDVRRFRPLTQDAFAVQQFLLGDSCRLIFDVGAFEGETVARYTDRFPSAEIYAFEPLPATYRKLAARFASMARVHLVNAAVSSRVGRATFHVNRLSATSSLLPRPSTGRRYFPRNGATSETITVPTITLDEFCAEQNLGWPNILKLDIQGYELEALRGAEQLLRWDGLQLILTEVTFVPHYQGGVLFDELCAHLQKRGFTLFNFYDLHQAAIGQLRFGDALFVSDKLRRTVINALPDEP